jgi:1-acyl-sn-glycerol-3-phosphate acyltransferase
MISFEKIEQFQKQLRETGAYFTDTSATRAWYDKMLGRFDTWYYLKLLRVVWSAHVAANRGQFDSKAWGAHSLEVLSNMEDVGAKISISGIEHAKKLNGPTVYVGNHMSVVELFLLPAILLTFNRMAAVAKESLLTYPIFGSVMRSCEPIALARVNPREDLQKVLTQGKAYLEKGRSVVLFPQATRSPVFDPRKFNTLGVKLAKAAGVPITPMALKTDFQKVGDFIKDIASLDREKVIRFKFGAPIHVAGSGRETQQQVIRFIQDNLTEWGVPVPS